MAEANFSMPSNKLDPEARTVIARAKAVFPYLLLVGLFSLLAGCSGDSAAPSTAPDPRFSGGDTTVFVTRSDAFSFPAANLSFNERADFQAGNSFFREPWVIAPSSTDARDGLGPLFNVNACQACHIRDGRGHAPTSINDSADSLIVKLGILTGSAEQQAALAAGTAGSIDEPTYGGQFHDRSNPNVPAEGKVSVSYSIETVMLADATTVDLRRPQLILDQLAYGNLNADHAKSARIAPPMIGQGLLEAIPEGDILAAADPLDKNADGISGKANRVYNRETKATNQLGRFGWKAGQPTVIQQAAAAFSGDIGLSSSLFPSQPCTASQTECNAQTTGGEPEVTDVIMELVHFYSQHLAVPGRRDTDNDQVIEGEQQFALAGCSGCHTPYWKTGQIEGRDAISNQHIFPYSDMLLHDMGADLADDLSEFEAEGSEWRTPPLWGIGLSQTVAGDQPIGYLHDGRAQTLLEAILWHGGEAQPSKNYVIAMTTAQRNALILFLKSL
jgi:CxxC motif-containing protein (DUF1111 family)